MLVPNLVLAKIVDYSDHHRSPGMPTAMCWTKSTSHGSESTFGSQSWMMRIWWCPEQWRGVTCAWAILEQDDKFGQMWSQGGSGWSNLITRYLAIRHLFGHWLVVRFKVAPTPQEFNHNWLGPPTKVYYGKVSYVSSSKLFARLSVNHIVYKM